MKRSTPRAPAPFPLLPPPLLVHSFASVLGFYCCTPVWCTHAPNPAKKAICAKKGGTVYSITALCVKKWAREEKQEQDLHLVCVVSAVARE